MKNFTWLVVWLFLTAALAITAYVSLDIASQVLAARNWQKAVCTITDSKIERTSTRGGYQYRLHVEFTYIVDGTAYRSARYQFSTQYRLSEYEAKQRLNDYPVGKQVDGYYNPLAPSEAVINRSFLQMELQAVAFVGLLWLALNGLIIWRAWRGLKKRKPFHAALTMQGR